MALFKAVSKGYDGVTIRERGDEFEFDGIPGPWMEPVDEAAKAMVKKLQEPKKLAAKKVEEKPEVAVKKEDKI